MKTFLSLLKVTLNMNFGFSALKHKFTREKKGRASALGISFGVIFGVGSLMVPISLFYLALFMGGKSLGNPDLVLTIAFVAGQLMVLILGLFYIMGAFYFSNDINVLIPMPIKPYKVMACKFITVLINEYLTFIPLVAPALIIYAVGMGQGIIYWLKAIALILVAPAIPLLVGSLFMILLMRFVNVRKSKDLLAIVGGFIGLFFALGSNYFTQKLPKSGSAEVISEAIAKSGLIESVGQKFPPAVWATYGLSKPGLEGLGYFALFIGLSILLLLALLWIGNKIFYRSFVSGQEITRKRKTLSSTEAEKKISQGSSPVIAMFWKEWKLFLRTPIYVMNGVMGMVIAPFLIVMPIITQSNEMGEILKYLTDPSYTLIVAFAGLGLMLFSTNLNIVASTALSREGSTFWISKMIPVSPKHQVLAKVIHSVVIETLGAVVTGIVLVSILKFSIPTVLLLLFLSVLGTVLLVSVNMMVDVAKPKLVWKNPQEAVKQNLNGVLGMLLSFIVIALLAGITVVMFLLGTPGWLMYIILGIFMAGTGLLSLWGLTSLAETRYSKLEA